MSAPGSTNHGALQGGAVENSNVDLTSRTGEPDHGAAQLSGERADDQDAADRRPDPDQPVRAAAEPRTREQHGPSDLYRDVGRRTGARAAGDRREQPRQCVDHRFSRATVRLSAQVPMSSATAVRSTTTPRALSCCRRRRAPTTRRGRSSRPAIRSTSPIQGPGWLSVQTADGGEAYTRAGNLHVDANGQLVHGKQPAGARQRRPDVGSAGRGNHHRQGRNGVCADAGRPADRRLRR